MIVRKAQLTDLNSIMQIEESSFIPQIQEKRDVFYQRILHCPELFLVFEINGKAAGYLSAEFMDKVPENASEIKLGHIPEPVISENIQNQYIYISSFAFLPEFRGNGRGKLAFENSLEYFSSHFKVKGFLLLVNSVWEGARHIYLSSGFREADFLNKDQNNGDRPFASFFPTEDGSFTDGILMIKE